MKRDDAKSPPAYHSYDVSALNPLLGRQEATYCWMAGWSVHTPDLAFIVKTPHLAARVDEV